MTLAAELYLGLDFGTLSVRALVTDVRGEVVASAAAPYTSGEIVRRAGDSVRFAQPLSAGWALQDPDDWPAASTPAPVVRPGGVAHQAGEADRTGPRP
jgi:ribulose kinase